MPRYDRIYATLVERAVRQGGIDAESFVAMARTSGMSDERLLELLLDDLENDGPIFGKFLRALAGAGESTVMAASRQGEIVGAVSEDAELLRLTGLNRGDVESALDTADPELAAAIEEASAEHLELVSVADLVNTCHVCLPLHGQRRTYAEWAELGLLPEQRHSGWISSCLCRLVPSKVAEGRAELTAPLARNKVEGKRVKGSRKTARAVTQSDLDKATAARDKAMQTKEGRRTLRLLGQSSSEPPTPGQR